MGAGPGFFQSWHGTITAGASFVEATQNSRTFTDAISVVRTVPGEDWLARRNRTSADFSSSYGLVSQPGSTTLKTSIYHADAERDEYFSPKAFAFGQALFDHNYSQGLDLQQTYVGGVGWSIVGKPTETLDLKAGVSYERQQFAGTTVPMSLAGSVFDEKFLRRFGKGATFTQELTVSPSWTNSRALSALGNSTVSLPVYKRFTFTVGATDNYLNDPPAGFKKNSVQFTTGLSYVLP
jgi:putative salt-induced outer membrane protein YdiY